MLVSIAKHGETLGESREENLVRPTFLHVDDRVELIDLVSALVTSKDSNGGSM